MDLEMDNKNVIFNKDKFKFTRNKHNNYTLEFIIENNNIEVPKIIDFNLTKLIFSLNTDIYDKINLEQIDDNNAIMTILIKNFFQDLGLPQYYCNIIVTKNIQENNIFFHATTNQNNPKDMPNDAKQLNVSNLNIICNANNNHMVNIHINIIFDNQFQIPLFVEKMAGLILNKIIKRLKLFIEKMIL